jgi:hypothetical protein
MVRKGSTAPAFLITIDTEGDGLWDRPTQVTTRNVRELPRFQELCERYRLKPTYVATYEAAADPIYQDFARDALRRDVAEVGMHLHAWNSPPLYDLTGDDRAHLPYLVEYPEDIIRLKATFLTELLEDTLQTKMLSHRAGRWTFDAHYMNVLVELGYEVDCSVTPHVSWRSCAGDPNGQGGSDYTHYPTCAYFPDPNDLSIPGDSPLLEVPMTVVARTPLLRLSRLGIVPAGSLLGRALPCFATPWFRPNRWNHRRLCALLRRAIAEQWDYVMLMLHSSELLAGANPTFRTETHIQALYDLLEQLFDLAGSRCEGLTLSEYRRRVVDRRLSSRG